MNRHTLNRCEIHFRLTMCFIEGFRIGNITGLLLSRDADQSDGGVMYTTRSNGTDCRYAPGMSTIESQTYR